MLKRFALLGAAGYIAPRHLQAIKDSENTLVAACDPNDSVGILDRYFSDVQFFKEFERFDRHVEKLRRKGAPINYVSICSPNYLHDAHIRFAMRVGADAICEKPLVLNPWNLDALAELEQEFGKRINTILQLRVHPVLIKLRQQVWKEKREKKRNVILTYITSRGDWYLVSWKGQLDRSGGLATNIGIHFFDLLIWLFGPVQYSEVHVNEPRKTGGYLELLGATVQWLLSIDRQDLPLTALEQKKTTFRSLAIDGKEIEFSEGFTNLHTQVYEEILAGRGFGIEDVRPSITLAHDIRVAAPKGIRSNSHPLLQREAS
ncbi:MAG: Gfo/Idh/MocA family oxidoreductase [Candidatus Latescibacteria bacterium]|nr:Gfo/Idh/MocA family oxidoreductase [Candidatus Latescibacterota bacterium]